jgi:hypothetical protein
MVVLTGSWNVRILFRAGTLIMLMQPLIQNNLDITMIPKKKKLDGWQGKSITDMKMHSFFLVGRKAAVVKKNVQNSNH